MRLINYLKHKFKANISSTFILEEIAQTVIAVVNDVEKEAPLKDERLKEFLKFEATILSFWLLKRSDIFPGRLHQIMLDEVHQQYYKALRKKKYNLEMLRKIANDINRRYRVYDGVKNDENATTELALDFTGFLTENTETKINLEVMIVPISIISQMTQKIETWRAVIK